MLKFLNKFHKLPKEIQRKISNKDTIYSISLLEKKYKLNLFALVIKVVIRDIELSDLEDVLESKYHIKKVDASNLKQDLIDNVLIKIKDHLGIELKKEVESSLGKELFLPKQKKVKKLMKYDHFHSDEHIDVLISKTKADNNKNKHKIVGGGIADKVIESLGIKFESKSKEFRFRTIISEYIRDVREDRLDIKNSLTNSEKNNGLGVRSDFADKILSTCNKYLQKNGAQSSANNDNYETRPQSSQPQQELKPKPSLDLDKISKRDIDYDLADILNKKADDINKQRSNPAIQESLNNKNVVQEKIDKKDLVLQKNINKKLDKTKDKNKSENATKTKLKSKKHKDFLSRFLALFSHSHKNKKPVKVKKNDKVKVSDEQNKMSPNDELRNWNNTSKLSYKYKDNKNNFSGLSQRTVAKKKHSDDTEKDKSTLKEEKKSDNESVLNKVDTSKRTVVDKRKKMDDIKKKPQLFNPISALKYMDTHTFRRLSDDPGNRTVKIFDKIDELGEVSFTKRLEAIQAWRESPVNKLYLQIGKESMANSQSYSDVARIRKENNKEFLLMDEVDVIMKLNNKLRKYQHAK